MKHWAIATILNWRWWVLLPLTIAILPVAFLQVVSAWTSVGAELLAEKLNLVGRTIYRPVLNWWRRSVKR